MRTPTQELQRRNARTLYNRRKISRREYLQTLAFIDKEPGAELPRRENLVSECSQIPEYTADSRTDGETTAPYVPQGAIDLARFWFWLRGLFVYKAGKNRFHGHDAVKRGC